MEFIYFSYLPQNSSNSTMNKKDSKLSKNYFTIHCSIKNVQLFTPQFQLSIKELIHCSLSIFNFQFSIKQLFHWSFSIFNFQFSIKEVFY